MGTGEVHHAGVDGPVRARRRGVGRLLDVLGDDDRGWRATGQRGADRLVEHVGGVLLGHDRHAVLRRDVLEQHLQVDLLLIMGAEGHALLLADDRQHRLVVELGVVQAVEQVIAPGPDVAMQTPSSPVNLACAHAANEAISS